MRRKPIAAQCGTLSLMRPTKSGRGSGQAHGCFSHETCNHGCLIARAAGSRSRFSEANALASPLIIRQSQRHNKPKGSLWRHIMVVKIKANEKDKDFPAGKL